MHNSTAFLWIFIFAYLAKPLLAHEGHAMPGALPPAPHGGMVAEAAHNEKDEHGHDEHEDGHKDEGGHKEHGDEHGGKEEAELFFEAVYKNKELTVYPIVILPTNSVTFTSVSAKTNMSLVSLKVEFPRAKKIEVLKPVITEEAFKAAFDAKGVNRFIVHIAVEHEKEAKTAKIQLENE